MSSSHPISRHFSGSHQAADNSQTDFSITSPIEIQFILKAVQQEKSLLSIFPQRSSRFLLSSILAIDPDRNILILDVGNDEALNTLVLKAETVVCVTTQNRIKIEFCCEKLQPIQFDDRPAFTASIPRLLLRFQRRNFYRIMTPVSTPATCLFPMLPSNEQQSDAVFNLFDISCGGMALIDQHYALDLEPGKIFAGCQVVLPEIDEIMATVAIRNSYAMTLKNGLTCQRAGCEFIGLPEDARVLIQRYITRLEQQERQFRRDS
ncbi:MAG: flagellar brake protein [Nitrosomonas sp.]|nr:flagellar brake protein [Nitrosomonas sp.]